MKLFKKIFRKNDKLSYKYESNTLAEINESPDMRLSTAKEREENANRYPVTKVKKSAKPSNTIPKNTVRKVKSAPDNKESLPGSTTEKPKQIVRETANSKATGAKKSPAKYDSASKTGIKNHSGDKSGAKQVAKADTQKKESEFSSSVADAVNEKNNEERQSRTGKFEIKKTKDGRFVFNLYASNNVIIATSQIYSSSTSAMNGIKSIIANAAIANIEDQTLKTVNTVSYPKWEIYRDKSDQFRFRLSASNGSCVCHSQGYTSKTNCKKGIESIIKSATSAEITKTYINKDKNT